MSTNKWIPGVTMIRGAMGNVDTWMGEPAHRSQTSCELAGWRAVDPPVDAPGEKRELVAGWRRVPEGTCAMTGCKVPAPFKWVARHHEIPYCERHADEYGAFATPAPAKTGCGDCGVEWCGQIMERMHPSGSSYSIVDTESPGPRYGSGACLRRAIANGTARAKPAEPKPAPTVDEVRLRAMQQARAEAQKKPAPTEKAKRCSVIGCGSASAVAMRVVNKSRGAEPICEPCYLGREKRIATANVTVIIDECQDAGPPARIGTVPQVLGPFVGVLGARGMRQP